MRVLLFLAIVLWGCTPTPELRKDSAGVAEAQPAIAFLTMRITQERPSVSRLELLDKKITAGTLKSPLNSEHGENYLTIESYEHGELVFSQTVDHPLFKEVEYVDSVGRMAMRSITVEHADFFVRVQLRGRSSVVKVTETLEDTPPRELASITLSQE